MATTTASHPAGPAAHDDRVDVPRGALWGAAALLGFTLLATGLVRWLGDGRSPSAPTAPVAVELRLQFIDQADGGIVVREADSGRLLETIPPGGEPFVRGTLRAMTRERRSHGLGAGPPFVLQAHADGRLGLTDTATQRRIDVGSFGPTQAAAFARLLPAPEASRRVTASAAGLTPATGIAGAPGAPGAVSPTARP